VLFRDNINFEFHVPQNLTEPLKVRFFSGFEIADVQIGNVSDAIHLNEDPLRKCFEEYENARAEDREPLAELNLPS
jgi:hypothetical protein